MQLGPPRDAFGEAGVDVARVVVERGPAGDGARVRLPVREVAVEGVAPENARALAAPAEQAEHDTGTVVLGHDVAESVARAFHVLGADVRHAVRGAEHFHVLRDRGRRAWRPVPNGSGGGGERQREDRRAVAE